MLRERHQAHERVRFGRAMSYSKHLAQVGDEVVVGEHDRLGQAAGAAGERQYGQVMAGIDLQPGGTGAV